MRLALRLCTCGEIAGEHVDCVGACNNPNCGCLEFEPDESAEGMPDSGYPERWR